MSGTGHGPQATHLPYGALARNRRLSRPRFEPESVIWLVLVAFVGLAWLLATFLSDQQFLDPDNVRVMLVSAVALGLVAVGQTVAIIAGSFDLSVAWVVSLGAILTATVMDGSSALIVPAVAAAVVAGVAVGVLNGLVITKLRVNAFIATLAVGLILSGVLNSQLQTRTGSVAEPFRKLGFDEIGFLPISVFLFAGFALAVGFTLSRTRTGHNIYATGASEDVARLSGIRSDRALIVAHAISGLGAALAGVFLASRLGSADPGLGPRGGYDLESIAVVVLGGSLLGGGRGRIAGTVAGVLIFAVLEGLFNVLQVDAALKTLLQGLIIIVAVASYAVRNVSRVA